MPESKTAQLAILGVELPGRARETLGVVLLDPASDELHVRLRRDLESISDDDDVEVLEALGDDLRAKAVEMGGEGVLRYCEDALSNTIRISGRETVAMESSAEATATQLYRDHVRPAILPFRTHLPVFHSLRAAAGGFGPERDPSVEPAEWLEAQEGLPLHENMFVARVEGRSMEPRIPDNSLCIFRANPVGSRQGKILLVERVGDAGSEVTVKVYRSSKAPSEDGGWKHEKIEMQPLNPEFPAWELREGDRLHVIAEFVDLYR